MSYFPSRLPASGAAARAPTKTNYLCHHLSIPAHPANPNKRVGEPRHIGGQGAQR